MCRSLLKIFCLKKLTTKKISLHCLFNSGIVVKCTCLGSAAHGPGTVGTDPPVVPSYVGPLQDTLLTAYPVHGG
jgi:hypothetical protein